MQCFLEERNVIFSCQSVKHVTIICWHTTWPHCAALILFVFVLPEKGVK